MKKVDLLLLGVVSAITLFGLLMIYNASSVRAFVDFNGDKYHYLRDQAIWVVLGFFVLFVLSKIDYHKLYYLALPLLVFALSSLILVFLPGIGAGAKGANRWINLFVFRFQPAEPVKLTLAIYLSAWFSVREKGRFLSFCLLCFQQVYLVFFKSGMLVGLLKNYSR